MTTLSLADNFLTYGKDFRGKDMSGILAMAESLKVNGVLKKLDVKFNFLGDVGEKALRDALCDHQWFELLV